jgi:hypothetical protein
MKKQSLFIALLGILSACSPQLTPVTEPPDSSRTTPSPSPIDERYDAFPDEIRLRVRVGPIPLYFEGQAGAYWLAVADNHVEAALPPCLKNGAKTHRFRCKQKKSGRLIKKFTSLETHSLPTTKRARHRICSNPTTTSIKSSSNQ